MFQRTQILLFFCKHFSIILQNQIYNRIAVKITQNIIKKLEVFGSVIII